MTGQEEGKETSASWTWGTKYSVLMTVGARHTLLRPCVPCIKWKENALHSWWLG